MAQAGTRNVSVTHDTDTRGDFVIVEYPVNSPEQAEFVDWWLTTVVNDLDATVPKMVEYGGVDGQSGSADLIVMGDAQAELMGHHDMPSPWKQSLACWFYLLGKVARMVSNYKRREWPKEDTVHDARVYLMMMQRLADQGEMAMKMRIEMLPKFDGIPQEKKEKAVEAFVKHLEEAKWFVGQREAEIEVFLMGPAGNRTLELSLDVNDAELTLV